MMWRHLTFGLALCSAFTGCANLEVKKVSEAKRVDGKDHAKGFRYYLARPYVVVKAPILVSESSTLYVLADRPTAPALSQSGPAFGAETVSRVNPASGAFESVSDAELAALRRLLSEPEPAPVRPVGHKTAAPATPVVIQQGAAGLSGLVATDAATDVTADAVAADATQTTGQSGTTASGGAGSNGTGTLKVPTVSTDPPPASRPTAPLKGDIEIIFLPDLDEQYAVHNCNVLSKSAYQLYFKDGWQLTDVSGEFDSTAVPLEILNFIDNAITAAKNVATAGIDQQARILGAADVSGNTPSLTAGRTVYQVITSTYLKPGVYRINKPWECDQDHPATGCGLLANMGLATFEATRVEVNPTLRTLNEIKQECVKSK
jgi:hypothetical protein